MEIRGAPILRDPDNAIDCNESGATLRFFLPIAGLCRGVSRFRLSKSLSERPIEFVLESLRMLDVRVVRDRLTIEIKGNGLPGGTVRLPGDVSSQFVSGFIFAATRANGTMKIELQSKLESETYVKMTLHALARHQAAFQYSADLREFKISGNQHLIAASHQIPGDYSAAAFLISAACITGSEIFLRGLADDPLQSDSQILLLAQRAGARVERMKDTINVHGPGQQLQPLDFDARHAPDLVPPLVAMGCFADGESRISGVGRLRFKESNRLAAMVSEFAKLGADVKMRGEELVVTGGEPLRGAEVDSHGDHRIAMALAIAALRAEGQTQMLGADCVSKSYPEFFRDLVVLNGRVSA